MAEQALAPEPTDKVLTVPNVISFVRLCFVPAFLVLLMQGKDIPACIVFAVAAGTDWVDGQIARRTNSVSKLGQLLDPFVDRCLMISVVVGLLLVGRVPLWIFVLVVARDLYLLASGYYLLARYKVRVPVIYPGKFAATLLYIGFAALLLNIPLVSGLGWTDASWLPGFNRELVGWGIWFVYAGLVMNVFTTAYYIYDGTRRKNAAKAALSQPSDPRSDEGR